ncbi:MULTISPECIES: hybrid sensor histidine kinase/response regulator [unclassified Acidovorax]|uniref:hybrid sensor histidine kinase/response regulator n=1 Tax=unclassified Acidovorax TaxID=2684926 RepID=UPI0037C68522
MRIKSQLFALVLSVLVPASVAAMLAIWYVYQEQQATQETGLKEAARTFSLLVDNELQSRQRVLRTIANAPSLASGDMATFYEFAIKNAPTPDTTIILFDTSGRQLLNTRVPLGTALPTQRASNINDLMQGDGGLSPLVSDVFFAPLGKRYDFVVQVPFMEGGVVRYFVVMGVNATAIQALLSEQNMPATWLSTIVDRKGTVLARSRDPDKFVGKSSDERLHKLFSSTTQGVTRSVTLDGVAVKTFYQRVDASDWTVVLSIPESEIQSSAIRGAGIFALAAVLLLVISLLVARRIGAGVISRMHRLEMAAEALGRGEQVNYSSQGLVEVDAVGMRIAQVSDRLLLNQRELELRVAQAVADTERAQKALLQGQKMEALGRLTGGIAHEFNNLLQTLSTSLQLAKRANESERVQGLLDTCTKALQRAKALTGQLSAFGRTQDARLETVSLPKHIQDFRQLVDNVLPASITLDVSMSQDAWPVTIDPTQFELAFLNLAINAKDAMPSGGTIRVVVGNEPGASPAEGLPVGDYVRLRFSDSGIGMTAEIMAKALDPFFTTKRVGEGTGLGLPQAFGFARQAGGTLVLHSREGQGTQVDIYLPRATGAVAGPHASAVRAPEAAGVSGGTLLFVEDDALVRESVAPALEGGGFFVIMAESADAALACLEAGTKVDFVFSDVVMPGTLNGIDLARTVVSRFPHIKVVLATGYSENRVSMPGVQVLAKPYDVADVLRVLRKAAD